MPKLAMKDSYFGTPIWKSDRPYLCFVFDESVDQLKALPFGLATAPGAYIKSIKPVAKFLGIRLVVYLYY